MWFTTSAARIENKKLFILLDQPESYSRSIPRRKNALDKKKITTWNNCIKGMAVERSVARWLKVWYFLRYTWFGSNLF